MYFENTNTHKLTNTYTQSNLSEDFFIDGEGEVQHVFYVVVLHPLERLVKLLVQILQVTQVTGTAWWEIRVSVRLCVCVCLCMNTQWLRKKSNCVQEHSHVQHYVQIK